MIKNKLKIPLLTDNYISSARRASTIDNTNIHLSSYISASKQIVTTASTPSEKKRKESTDFPKIEASNSTRKLARLNSIRFDDRVKIKKTMTLKNKTNDLHFNIRSGYNVTSDKYYLQSDRNLLKTNRIQEEFSLNTTKNQNYNNYESFSHRPSLTEKDGTYMINQTSNPSQSNIFLIKRLMQANPYKDIPKKVKYSSLLPNQIEQKTVTNLPSRKLTKQGYQLKDTGTSSILYKPVDKPENFLIKLLKITKDNFSKVFSKSIKMKCINWIIKNKGAYVDLLVNCYKEVKWFLNSKDGKLDKILFNELLTLLDKKDGKDQDFTDLIFLIFDNNKRGIIEYKEIIVWFILYINDSYLRKIENMIDICLIANSSNLVQLEEIFSLIKSCTMNKTEAKRFQEIIKNLSINLKSSNVDKNVLYRELISNEEMKSYLIRNSEIANDLENQFDEEIETISNMNLKRSKYYFK
jgi:hypothetical protein